MLQSFSHVKLRLVEHTPECRLFLQLNLICIMYLHLKFYVASDIPQVLQIVLEYLEILIIHMGYLCLDILLKSHLNIW